MQIYINGAYIFNTGDTKKTLTNLISIKCFCPVLLKYRKLKCQFTPKNDHQTQYGHSVKRITWKAPILQRLVLETSPF